MRHDLPMILFLTVTGVLAGWRSLTAIWKHTTDLTGVDLEALGLEEGQTLPSRSTIRRVPQGLDPAGLDARLTTWMHTPTGTIKGRTAIAARRQGHARRPPGRCACTSHAVRPGRPPVPSRPNGG